LLAAIEQETAIPSDAKDMAALLGQPIADLGTRIKEIEVELTAAHNAKAVSQRLATIRGVGPVTALTLGIPGRRSFYQTRRPPVMQRNVALRSVDQTASSAIKPSSSRTALCPDIATLRPDAAGRGPM
jgi:hypothetical protein